MCSAILSQSCRSGAPWSAGFFARVLTIPKDLKTHNPDALAESTPTIFYASLNGRHCTSAAAPQLFFTLQKLLDWLSMMRGVCQPSPGNRSPGFPRDPSMGPSPPFYIPSDLRKRVARTSRTRGVGGRVPIISELQHKNASAFRTSISGFSSEVV